MNDQRRYTKADILLVRRIRKLLYEDRYTIAGAKRRLRQESARDAGAAAVDLESVRALRQDVDELITMLDRAAVSAA
jgi:DNA-binding transcriptional MerR regulator